VGQEIKEGDRGANFEGVAAEVRMEVRDKRRAKSPIRSAEFSHPSFWVALPTRLRTVRFANTYRGGKAHWRCSMRLLAYLATL